MAQLSSIRKFLIRDSFTTILSKIIMAGGSSGSNANQNKCSEAGNERIIGSIDSARRRNVMGWNMIRTSANSNVRPNKNECDRVEPRSANCFTTTAQFGRRWTRGQPTSSYKEHDVKSERIRRCGTFIQRQLSTPAAGVAVTSAVSHKVL